MMDMLQGGHGKGQCVENVEPEGEYVISFTYRGSEVGYCAVVKRVRQVRKTREGCINFLNQWIEKGRKELSITIEDIRIYKIQEKLNDVKVGTKGGNNVARI